jgi:chromosome segregation ATPase
MDLVDKLEATNQLLVEDLTRLKVKVARYETDLKFQASRVTELIAECADLLKERDVLKAKLAKVTAERDALKTKRRCDSCGGSGQQLIVDDPFPMYQSCSDCEGTGIDYRRE